MATNITTANDAWANMDPSVKSFLCVAITAVAALIEVTSTMVLAYPEHRAKEKGYTEPDPRDDLGGVDVARKALILARGLGWRLELSDVNVEPLYPTELASLSVDDFMAKLPSLDADFAKRASEAKARGEALRYAATVEDGRLNVGLVSVSSSSPLGSLEGTDNLVEYYTTWYDPSPLVVRGAGAGAGATAAGALADMVELAV